MLDEKCSCVHRFRTKTPPTQVIGTRLARRAISNLALFTHELRTILRFGFVGGTGMVVDVALMMALLQVGIKETLAAALAIWVAMSWNYLGNRWWTFSLAARRDWIRQYLHFCLSCLAGAAVNWGARVSLMRNIAWFQSHPWAAALIGVLFGFGFNYAGCRLIVFNMSSEA
ncbi:MAG: hypothetical protein KatS3mg113_0939 [Planctomycetaceae bacterium]|nr:MAG: hypothetical protein KatS3mg113_0939 [Planctomycetaceae bacterium]